MLDIHIKRRQGEFQIDTAFQSEDVGVTALFGNSGAGKTSIINMISGLVRPDEGHVIVGGRCLFDSKSAVDLAPEKRHIGYIFQEGRLFPHLSVRKNLTFGMQRTEKKRRYVDFDEVVTLLGIEHLIDRSPAKLSGGEKQRVAIGRALLTSPSLLLMDEPLASLDEARKDEVLPFIARLSRRFSIPIIYVSHSLEEIFALADTMVVLSAGRAVASGPTEDIVQRRDLQHLIGYAEGGAMVSTKIEAYDETGELTLLRFAGGILKVPRLDLPIGTTVRIRIKARNVVLALVPPQQISVQNILPGVVEEIYTSDGPLVDVRLDIGCPLSARITHSAMKKLKLKPGSQVFTMIKSVAVSHASIG